MTILGFHLHVVSVSNVGNSPNITFNKNKTE